MLRRIKNYFFSAFREIFVYHHNSLEFRAKTYAVLIGSSAEAFHHYEKTLGEIASEIYADSDRASALILTVKEYLSSIHTKKTITDEALLIEIIKELRLIPRYALKIEPDHLLRLRECTHDHDSKIYQERLIEFMGEKRREYEASKG